MEHNPDRLRLARKLLHTALQQKQIRQYRDAQEYHISTFLTNLLEDPKDFFRHIRQYVTRRIATVVFFGIIA